MRARLRLRRAMAAAVIAAALLSCRREPLRASPDDAPAKNGPKTCPTGAALIPGGSFTNGSTSEAATVGDLCMDVSEVTVSAYAACVERGACTTPTAFATTDDAPLVQQPACNWKHPEGRQSHPINCVTWDQAVAFCSFAGGRLPTEAEWEWVARGGAKGTTYPWGDAKVDGTNANACGVECSKTMKVTFLRDVDALYPSDDGFEETAPVGSFPKGDNPWAVHDLAGNVWEWTSTITKWDWTEAESHSPSEAPPAVIRGGAWNSDKDSQLLATARDRSEPSRRYASVGFRCVRSP